MAGRQVRAAEGPPARRASGGRSSRPPRRGPAPSVSMVVVRFLFGAGEAGCFPNITKAFTAWLPPRRARARAGGALAGRAVGRRRHAAAGGGGARPGVVVAAGVRAVRPARVRVGVLLLPLVSRQPARSPVGQRCREAPAHGRREPRVASRPGAVACLCPIALGLAAVDSVRVPELRLVLLRHLVSHVSRADARRDDGPRDAGRAGRPPAVRRRHRIAHLGLLRRRARQAGGRRRPRAQGARRLRLRGGRRVPARCRPPTGAARSRWPCFSGLPGCSTTSPCPARGARAWTWAGGSRGRSRAR